MLHDSGRGWWLAAFVLLFVLLPLGYGWGYRGWGPPRRLRCRPVSGPPAARPAPRPREPIRPDEAEGWGWAAVALWVVVAIAAVWFVLVLVISVW